MVDNSKFQIKDNIITTPPSTLNVVKNGLGSALYKAMKQHGNNIAQIDAITGREETFTSLLQRCVRTAITMKNHGVECGDIISLCTFNSMNSCVPYIAAQLLGVKVCSLDPILSLLDTTYLLSQVDVKQIFVCESSVDLIVEALRINGQTDVEVIVFGESETHAKFSDFVLRQDGEDDFTPVNVDVHETAVIFFSSGTSGLPKGIEIKHYSLFVRKEEIPPKSVFLGYPRLYWISGIQYLNFTTFSGITRLICEDFDVETVWQYLDEYQVSFMLLACSCLLEIIKTEKPAIYNASHLKAISAVGSSFSVENLSRLREIFPTTLSLIPYGCTEAAGAITAFHPKSMEDIMFILTKGSSAGQPLDGFSYKIVDLETERALGPNQRGEIRVKSITMMKGYHNIDSTQAFDSDGWLKTGDIGYYDEDFCFYIVDRIKEVMKYKTLHVVPARIESTLLSHSEVLDAVVIGYPNEEDGEHPMGIILRTKGSVVSEEELIKYIEDKLDDLYYLRGGVKFVDNLPYTPSGKVQRKVLKDKYTKTIK